MDGPSIEKLHEGRKENLEIIEKKGLAALDLYTGHLYSVFDFKNAVRGAVESKTHCLISHISHVPVFFPEFFLGD